MWLALVTSSGQAMLLMVSDLDKDSGIRHGKGIFTYLVMGPFIAINYKEV